MKDNFWVEESSGNSFVCKKRKRRVGKRKIEFVGWGSRPLIEFLEAIGQDTSEKHSRHEVSAFITKYINDKGLASAEKKKKVICDERLYALFGKKSMSRIKVYDMLEEHFAENHDDSDDESLDSSDDEDYEEKSSLGSKSTGQIKKEPKTPKSCFAAIIPENIKLIYLKKIVIQELLKFPESFEFKIVGSFVRMKSDPNDIYQKNRFQLQQVTGVGRVSGAGDAGIEIHLRVSNFFKDIPICMLSDDNFSEEEVEDVRDRIKAGSLSRLTVNELQSKAEVLHADITKHWIAKEISLLQKLIEHANEKGWQRQKFEYLERRKMLQTPSEQEKLLLTIPEVIAEEPEPEATVAAASEKIEANACSPKSILRGSSDVSSTDASGSGEIVTPRQVVFSGSHALKVQNGDIDGIVPVNDPKGDQPADIIEEILVANVICDGSSRGMQVESSGEKVPHAQEKLEKLPSTASVIVEGMLVAGVICDGSSREMQVESSGEKDTHAQEKAGKLPSTASVIELSDDDSEDEGPKREDGNTGESPNDSIWHYVDPHGHTRGPFPLYLLKRWSDANYFHSGFTVWKSGQTLDDGVLLVDVLRRTFPH